MAGYKSFNMPSGKPGKSAGGGRFVSEKKKSQSFANESGTPGQSISGMSAFSRGSEPGSSDSAATKTYTLKKS